MWTLYGTAYRSAYTIYEVTFAGPVEILYSSLAFDTLVSGNWPTNARPVLDKVSQFYSIFFVVYITIIVFALIRVISAIFLKERFSVLPSQRVESAVMSDHKWQSKRLSWYLESGCCTLPMPGLPVRRAKCTDFDVQ